MSDNKKQTFIEQLILKLKENLVGLISGILSISAINYVLSRLFLIEYLKILGFNGALYSAMADESSKNLIFLGIMAIFFGSFITIIGMPIILRYFYHGKEIPSFLLSDRQNKTIDKAMFISFLSIYAIVLFVIYQGTSDIWVGLGVIVIYSLAIFGFRLYWIFQRVLPAFTFCQLIKGGVKPNFGLEIEYDRARLITNVMPKHELSFRKMFGQSVVHALIFAFVLFFLIFVCLYFLALVSGSSSLLGHESENWKVLLVTGIIWFLYSLVFGLRVTEHQRLHFILDLAMGCVLIYILLIINASLFAKVIAETTGIKDRGAYVYRMKTSDFEAIKNDVQKWEKYITPATDEELAEKFKLDNALKIQEDEVYLATTMIYKNEKNAIICPPKIDIFSNQNWVCSFVERDKFIPTALSMDELKKEKP